MALTFFFRDMQALDAITSHVIPHLAGHRHLDIWDAGCASGEEPYTLAILLKENMGEFQFRNVRILATDLNASFQKTVGDAVYSEDQVRRIPDDIRRKHFEPAGDGDKVKVKDEIRRAVAFHHHDLTSLKPIRDELGLIVCKNVLLHLSPAQRIDVYHMFYDALSAKGFLATEMTQKMPPQAAEWFVPVHGDGPVFQRAA